MPRTQLTALKHFSIPAPIPLLRLRPWLMKSLMLSGLVLLVGVMVAVYYLSLSAPTPQPLPLAR